MSTDIPQQPNTPPPATPQQPAPLPAIPPAAPDTPVAKRPLSPLVAGLIGVAIGATVMGGIWAIAASNGPSKPATFTLEGSFELTDGASDNGSGCEGTGGYD